MTITHTIINVDNKIKDTEAQELKSIFKLSANLYIMNSTIAVTNDNTFSFINLILVDNKESFSVTSNSDESLVLSMRPWFTAFTEHKLFQGVIHAPTVYKVLNPLEY